MEQGEHRDAGTPTCSPFCLSINIHLFIHPSIHLGSTSVDIYRYKDRKTHR